jgi:predicted Rossmann-fold nucleotide-binding protein
MNNIYISYAWKDTKTDLGKQRELLVDKICDKLTQNKYKLIRDKQHLALGNSIKDFMREIGRGNYVIIVISDKYLRSEYCMFEAVEIMKYNSYGQQIFPIILSDANIYSHEGKLTYIKYWKEQYEKLKQMVEEVTGKEDNFAMYEILEKFKEIADTIDDFIVFVSDKLSIDAESNLEGFVQNITLQMQQNIAKTREKQSIYVVGTGRYDLPQEIYWCAKHLGRLLAEENYNLISGGWQGVDYVIAESFAMVLQEKQQALSEKLYQVVPKGKYPEFKGGTIEYVESGIDEWLACLKKADIVILIGGVGGTYETFLYAKQENVPLIPIVCTNGDAKKVYDELLANWNEKTMRYVSEERFKSLNQFIDAEKTAISVMQDVIAIANDMLFAKNALQ